MTPYFLRLLPCTAGVGGTENEEYMKKIRPYLWRGGALVLAAALVVLLVLSGMGLSTQEPEPLPQPPAQTIRTEGQGGASQQEKPNAPEQPEDPEDEDTPEEPETPEQPDEEPPQEEPDAPEQPENPTDNPAVSYTHLLPPGADLAVYTAFTDTASHQQIILAAEVQH